MLGHGHSVISAAERALTNETLRPEFGATAAAACAACVVATMPVDSTMVIVNRGPRNRSFERQQPLPGGTS